MSEEASIRDVPQQRYLERGTIQDAYILSGRLHPSRMLTSFFDGAMRDSLRLNRVVSSFLAAIAQMWKLGVDGGAGTKVKFIVFAAQRSTFAALQRRCARRSRPVCVSRLVSR